MNGHLDVDALADLQEGLLTADEAAAAQSHLAVCPQCTAEQDALTDVRGLLSEAPGPGPMPDDVAARIEAALAAEPVTTEPPASSVTVLPQERGHRRTAPGTGILQAAAVIVLLLALGAVGVSFVRGGGAGGDNGASGGAAETIDRRSADSGAFPVLATGTDYTERSVEAAVPRLLSTRAHKAPDSVQGEAEPYAGGADTNRLASRPALAGCVAELAQGPAVPLAVDLARYGGQPATVIVLPTEGDRATVDVWVVGPGCVQGDAQVRLFERVARP